MQKKIISLCFIVLTLCITRTLALHPPDPEIKSVSCEGAVDLDFSGSGNNYQIALFTINDNDSAGFSITFQFTDSCKFECGKRVIPMTTLLLNQVGGTLGDSLKPPLNANVLNNLSNGNEYTWDFGTTQTKATVNYIVELKASWANAARMLAGFYSETITATVNAHL